MMIMLTHRNMYMCNKCSKEEKMVYMKYAFVGQRKKYTAVLRVWHFEID